MSNRSRRPAGIPRSTPSSEGTAYVYIAPCRFEDILKLGFSRDPLERLQSLHPRWYEFFDLDAAWLVETDRVREARDLELQLRHGILLHNAPAPLVVVRAAAGHTEWFRGALPALEDAGRALEAIGHRIHRPLQPWLQQRLLQRSDRLWHWSEEMLLAIEHATHVDASSAGLAPLQRQLRDALDAYPALGLALDERVPSAVLQWRRAHAGGG
jgi:hypothetical protein